MKISQKLVNKSMNTIKTLLKTIAYLRSPEGCAWDRAQTHHSLQPCLIEEAAEVLQAIDIGNDSHLKEELGDLLLQVLLHAQIASERGAFDFQAIAQALNEKLIRRHPHVFGDANKAETDAEALQRWRSIKAQEKAAKGLLSHEEEELPPTLSGLLYASKTLSRAEKANGPIDCPMPMQMNSQEALGDALLHLVYLARQNHWNPETAIREALKPVVMIHKK
jgi:uncharacterized protein YabN with tetrapyrrole methylase and pyrophosphatase domain